MLWFLTYLTTCITGLIAYKIRCDSKRQQKEIEMEALHMLESNDEDHGR